MGHFRLYIRRLIMKNRIIEFIFDQRGQGLVEYSIILSFLIILVIGSVIVFGETLTNIYQNNIVDHLP